MKRHASLPLGSPKLDRQDRLKEDEGGRGEGMGEGRTEKEKKGLV